jgi:hypothetical protein
MRIFRPFRSADGLDLLLEPARHLHAGVAAGHGHHAEGRVDLVPQLDAAAVVEPAVHALEVQAEGHGGEVLRGEGLAGPEVAVGVVHLHRAGTHRIEALERRDQLAGAEDLDVQPPARHLADALGQVGGRARAVHVEGRALAVGAGHLPVEGLLGGCDGRHGHCGAGKTGLENLTTNPAWELLVS